MSTDAAHVLRPSQGRGSAGRRSSFPLALILLGAVLNVAWIGILGWALLRALASLFG